MGERVRSPDSEHDRKSDEDKNSDSYYSDEDNASHSSGRSPTLSCQSTNQGKKDHKTQTSDSLVQYQATKKLDSKYAPSKRGTRWGFRSQSLTRDSPAKDIDLVTKRVLSARLLKINELRNELTELHIKLDELQKENRALKRLQHRQEKALNKFEDTENEISQLLARHNNEIRILRERLRKSQERERATERRLKDSEDELYRTKTVLQKLKKLSADKHLAERDDLAKKLAYAENRLEDTEKRIKDLEKNLELSSSSFQRQLLSEKKKVHEAHEENRILQEEMHQLNQRLKEKERELEAKNIYANRMLKLSPRKDMDVIQRKKANNQNIKKGAQLTKGVQTSGYFSPVEFPPESELVCDEAINKKEGVLLRIEKETQDKELKEQADLLRQDQDGEREEKLKHVQELQALEGRVQKLHDVHCIHAEKDAAVCSFCLIKSCQKGAALGWRITERLRSEGTSGDHLGQPVLLKQSHLEHVAQDPVQTAFEDLQRRRLHHLSGQPVPVLCHPHSKEVFPQVQRELPVFPMFNAFYIFVDSHVFFLPDPLIKCTSKHQKMNVKRLFPLP
ncbi:lebercilin isoform X2 [Struthio camelus]|uniref:lebercilin isoform X2 n=1 Tax=Struthio camelus TaxID=8801 RepID=UPI003603C7A3